MHGEKIKKKKSKEPVCAFCWCNVLIYLSLMNAINKSSLLTFMPVHTYRLSHFAISIIPLYSKSYN